MSAHESQVNTLSEYFNCSRTFNLLHHMVFDYWFKSMKTSYGLLLNRET